MPDRHQPAPGEGQGVFSMRRRIIRALYAAVAAGTALATLGIAGVGAPAMAAPASLGSASYHRDWAGYTASGRWFRFGFDPLPLAPGFLAALQAGAKRDGAQLRVITDEAATATLAAVLFQHGN